MLKETVELWAFGATKVPMIYFLRPRILELSGEKAQLRIPLSRRAKNHAGSMYFGALASGADMLPGIVAFTLGRRMKKSVSFAFKECHAQFLRKADHDVTFACDDVGTIERAIRDSSEANERRDAAVTVKATISNGKGVETVAQFDMVLSVRAK